MNLIDETPAPGSRAEASAQRAANDTRSKSRTKKALWIGISVFLVMVLAAGGIVGSFLWKLNNSFQQAETIEVEQVFPAEETRPAPATVAPEAQNILLLGSDTRGAVGQDLDTIRGQRSDTIMLAHVPENRESVQVVSIMRDYWVEIPGHGMNKINAALSFGGVPLLVQTLEGLLGVRIDRLAIIDFEGFKGLTNALGGVMVNNPQAFTSRGHTFNQGEIILNGDQALEFVRARYPFTDGDYTRVRNQQLFLKGVMQKLFTRETLTNPGMIAETVDQFSPYLTVDAGFDSAYLTGLGLSLRDIRTENLRFFTAPTLGTGMEGSQSVVYPDWASLEQLALHLQNDTVDQYEPTGR